MNFIGVHLYPNLLEESRRELERERQRDRQIQEARAARRAEQPSLVATLRTRLRRSTRPDPCDPVVEAVSS